MGAVRRSQLRTFLNGALVLAIFVGAFVYAIMNGAHQHNDYGEGHFDDENSMSNLPASVNCDRQSSWMTMELDEMTAQQLFEYFRWGNSSSCLLRHDLGGKILAYNQIVGLDGQKAVCIEPTSLAPHRGNCTVYSFGINNEWSFDDTMEQYGCQVYAFDPSMAEVEPMFNRSPAIHFLKIGLGKRDETLKESGWKMLTLSSIYRLLNHAEEKRIIDYLKIDVEGAEWEALVQIMESGMLSSVRQLGLEIHFPGGEPLSKYKEFAGVLHSIERQHQMVRFDCKPNPWMEGTFPQLNVSASFGYEIAWYNNKFLK